MTEIRNSKRESRGGAKGGLTPWGRSEGRVSLRRGGGGWGGMGGSGIRGRGPGAGRRGTGAGSPGSGDEENYSKERGLSEGTHKPLKTLTGP